VSTIITTSSSARTYDSALGNSSTRGSAVDGSSLSTVNAPSFNKGSSRASAWGVCSIRSTRRSPAPATYPQAHTTRSRGNDDTGLSSIK
jgi:hypothetical protein